MAKNYDYGSKSIKPWGYIWLTILYIIPVLGQLVLLINALFARNTNVKNHARSFFCAIAFVIILAVIAGAIVGLLYLVAPETLNSLFAPAA